MDAEKAAHAWIHGYSRAWRARDPEAVAAIHADGAVLDGGQVTLAGCVLLRLGSDGRCVDHRDYWAIEAGRRPPPTGWSPR